MILDVFLQAAVAVSSIFAGVFWLASATGSTVKPPWGKPFGPVAPADRPAHHTYWNIRAAFYAAIAASSKLYT
jgi:hypothetical protein